MNLAIFLPYSCHVVKYIGLNRAKIEQNTGNDCAIGMRNENSLTNIRISCMPSWREAGQIRVIFDMIQNRIAGCKE